MLELPGGRFLDTMSNMPHTRLETRPPMTITVELGPEEESKLLGRAAQSGQDVTTYIHRVIARDIQGVDEALAPFRRQVEESGLSDADLGAFFEEVREEVWQQKNSKSSQAS
jgi:hypothetical protein